jgi:hypothetical protein
VQFSAMKFILVSINKNNEDRAIAEEVGCQLPTVAARVRSQVMSCGICWVKSGTGVGFLRVLRFHLQILIPPSVLIIRGWYNRLTSGQRTEWTHSQPTSRIKEKMNITNLFQKLHITGMIPRMWEPYQNTKI